MMMMLWFFCSQCCMCMCFESILEVFLKAVLEFESLFNCWCITLLPPQLLAQRKTRATRKEVFTQGLLLLLTVPSPWRCCAVKSSSWTPQVPSAPLNTSLAKLHRWKRGILAEWMAKCKHSLACVCLFVTFWGPQRKEIDQKPVIWCHTQLNRFAPQWGWVLRASLWYSRIKVGASISFPFGGIFFIRHTHHFSSSSQRDHSA